MSLTVLGEEDIQRLLSDFAKALMRSRSSWGKGTWGASQGSAMSNFDC